MLIRAGIRHLLPLISLAILASTTCAQSANSHPTKWAIAIHGGAGEEEWQHMYPATAEAYHASLARALQAGAAVLSKGGRSIDAVQAAIESGKQTVERLGGKLIMADVIARPHPELAALL